MSRRTGSCGHFKPCDAKVMIDFDHNGIEINIKSKYSELFGSHIRKAVLEVLKEEAIQDINVLIEDDGALDFVIKARLRTAIRRVKGYEEA